MQKRYQVLIGLSVLSIITYLDRTAISMTGIQMSKDLNLNEKQFGYVLAAFSLAYGLFEMPAGYMGDKWGAKSTLIRVVLWWSVFTFFTGLSTTFAMLLIVRFLFGMGEAGAYPNISISVSRWFPKQERGRSQAIIWMLSRFGGAIAPIIIGFMMKFFSWHYVFYSFGIIGIVWAIFWQKWFRNEPRDMPNISNEELIYIENNRSLVTKHTHFSLKKLLTNSNLWALYGGYFSLASTAYFYISWLPKYLHISRNVPMEDLAFMSSLPFIMGMFGCFIGGFASDYLVKKMGLKYGRRIVGFTGLFCAGICILIATQIFNLHIAIIFLSLGLAFKDFVLPVSWTAATDIGGKNAGAISGTMNMIAQIGATITSIVFGYMVTYFKTWDSAVMMFGFLVIAGSLCWLKVDASKPFNPDKIIS